MINPVCRDNVIVSYIGIIFVQDLERDSNMNKDLIDNFVKVYTPGTELAKPDKNF